MRDTSHSTLRELRSFASLAADAATPAACSDQRIYFLKFQKSSRSVSGMDLEP